MRKILLLTGLLFFVFLALGPVSASAVSITPSPSPTPGTGTYVIPIGLYGCSFKIESDKVIAVIGCASGGVCYPEQGKTTYNPQTNTFENGHCISTGNRCPVCDSGYQFSWTIQKCVNASNLSDQKDPIRIDTCADNQGCSLAGTGCESAQGSAIPLSACPDGICRTALGNIPTNPEALVQYFFGIILSLAGIIALALIIFSGYRLMMSQGNPEQVKNARDQLTAAILGLLFIIFSFVILQVIGIDILKIPGFGG